jgi:hypothetical protein
VAHALKFFMIMVITWLVVYQGLKMKMEIDLLKYGI